MLSPQVPVVDTSTSEEVLRYKMSDQFLVDQMLTDGVNDPEEEQLQERLKKKLQENRV